MRIVCPACEATYDVPDALLAGRPRVVRCVRCGKEWTPVASSIAPLPPDEPLAAPLPPPLPLPPLPEPIARPEPRLKPLRARPEFQLAEPLPEPEEEPVRRSGGRAVVAWVLTILVLAAAGGAAVQWRAQVIAAWPPSERVYAALGLS